MKIMRIVHLKKLVSMGMLTLCLPAALLSAGCGAKDKQTPENSGANEQENVGQGNPGTGENEETWHGYRMGLAIETTMKKSLDAQESEGTAQVDALAVAVLLDEEGRIADCSIDMMEAPMSFSQTGQVLSPLDQEFQTKKELGDAYGLKNASGIGKEWYEQVDAFERYVKGKTVEELENISLTETSAPADAQLSASVTIKVGDYVDALVKAAENAEPTGSGNGDRIGVGIQTHMRNSKDAADGEEGSCQAYSYYAAVTANGDGTITGCILDSTQTDVTFDENGRITVSELDAPTATKREMGDSYGLGNVSGIGREWYEQADAFEDYIDGKTLEEIMGIAVDENMRPAEDDLSSSVTIAIGDFRQVIEKACQRMKAE